MCREHERPVGVTGEDTLPLLVANVHRRQALSKHFEWQVGEPINNTIMTCLIAAEVGCPSRVRRRSASGSASAGQWTPYETGRLPSSPLPLLSNRFDVSLDEESSRV
jgi:hypothetical protein